MQIAGIRSVLNGRTTRPDATGRAAEPAQPVREASGPGRNAALVPLPPSSSSSPAGAVAIRPVVIAFPASEEQKAAATRPAHEAQRAYRDMQTAAPRAALALVEEAADVAEAPARTARAARAVAAARDEAPPEAPRPAQAGVPGIVAQGLAALLRLVPGQAGAFGEERRKEPATAAAARPGERPDTGAGEGGWTEALTLFTLVATVCLALWLLVF